MKAQGREHAEWGFKKPADGWHVVEILEGIGLVTYKEEKDGHAAGEVVKDKKGNELYKIPARINDEKAEDNEADISQTVSATAFGEQKIADILAGVGEFDNFNTKFPGERSFFEPEIMNAIKVRIPGKFLRMRTETKGEYSNVVEIANMAYKPTEKVGAKGKAKSETGGASSNPAAASKAPAGWD
jgi:hypothetical protein